MQWPSVDPPIAWRSWDEETWHQAQELDRPVLLYLATPGGEGTFAEGGAALELMVVEQFVPIRADPFHRPDLARRFGAGGWPTVALLLPDGRLFAKAVDVPPDNARMYLWRLLGNYEKWREQIVNKVDRAQALADTPPTYELDVEEVFLAAVGDYDDARGGFGEVQKFPEPAVLEFLLEYADYKAEGQAGHMVHQTLDRLFASPMVTEGGVAAFSHTPDWRTPVAEFDAADQAGILRVLLTADAVRHDSRAGDLVDYIGRHLYQPGDGYFRGRRLGYRSEVGDRLWWTDPVPYADRNAVLISACLLAAARLGDSAAREMASAAGDYLLEHCIAADGGVRHTCSGADGELTGLPEDQLLVAAALLDLFEATGDDRYSDGAQGTMTYNEETNYDARRRAFVDHYRTVGAGTGPWSAYGDDMLPAGNGLAIGLYVRMGDLDLAGGLLKGPRLRTPPARRHATAARALIHYRQAVTSGGDTAQ